MCPCSWHRTRCQLEGRVQTFQTRGGRLRTLARVGRQPRPGCAAASALAAASAGQPVCMPRVVRAAVAPCFCRSVAAAVQAPTSGPPLRLLQPLWQPARKPNFNLPCRDHTCAKYTHNRPHKPGQTQDFGTILCTVCKKQDFPRPVSCVPLTSSSSPGPQASSLPGPPRDYRTRRKPAASQKAGLVGAPGSSTRQLLLQLSSAHQIGCAYTAPHSGPACGGQHRRRVLPGAPRWTDAGLSTVMVRLYSPLVDRTLSASAARLPARAHCRRPATKLSASKSKRLPRGRAVRRFFMRGG